MTQKQLSKKLSNCILPKINPITHFIMAQNKSNLEEKRKLYQIHEKRQDARIKMFIQMLDVKRDTNMTRIYSAIQPIKNSLYGKLPPKT